LAELVSAIVTINDRWSVGRYSNDLRNALERLNACDLGGIARLIEALPLPETFRGQFAQLNAPEREVLIHMSAGLNSSEVATLSGQTTESVDAIIVSLCRKLGCSSPRHAVALAKSVDGLRIIAVNVR
jgi:DNA-binding CsgD family transcriptional regulator